MPGRQASDPALPSLATGKAGAELGDTARPLAAALEGRRAATLGCEEAEPSLSLTGLPASGRGAAQPQSLPELLLGRSNSLRGAGADWKALPTSQEAAGGQEGANAAAASSPSASPPPGAGGLLRWASLRGPLGVVPAALERTRSGASVQRSEGGGLAVGCVVDGRRVAC